MPKKLKPSGDALKHYALTVNQVVSHNLSRARRSRGWTQEETAARLEAVSGKKWTAATLSASERAVATGRPRTFDANELISFSRVFEYPVGYFLLPIEPQSHSGERQFLYLLTRLGEVDGVQTERLLEMTDLLYSVIPLRYPAVVVDTVNRLLADKGIVWQPDARVEWDDGSDVDYETLQYLEHEYENDPVSLDDWKTITAFAELSKRIPAAKLLRLMADAVEEPPTDEGVSFEDTPF